MPFKKYDIKKEIQQMKESDPELKFIYEVVEKKHNLIIEAKKMREEMGVVTLAEIAAKINVSEEQIEKIAVPISLHDFIAYLSVIGLELKIINAEQE